MRTVPDRTRPAGRPSGRRAGGRATLRGGRTGDWSGAPGIPVASWPRPGVTETAGQGPGGGGPGRAGGVCGDRPAGGPREDAGGRGAWIARGTGCLGLLLAFLGLLPGLAAADVDVGQIAVVEADPRILQPGEPFDLAGHTLTLTPRAGGGYDVAAGALAFESDLGTRLPLGDDDSAQQALPFVFRFFEVPRTTVFINANGNLTFVSGSGLAHFHFGGSVGAFGSDLSTVLDRFAASVPRIAALWQDWDPSAGGGVFARLRSDRLVVTWNHVPLFGTPGVRATFQAVLFATGVIRVSYASVPTTPGGGYLVGLSPGGQNEFLTTTLDLSAVPGGSISAFPRQEVLVQVFGASARPLVHVSAVARRFFRTHADTFDQLVLFATFPSALGNAFAFELTTRQTISGIGLGLSDISSFFGSAGRLQSVLNMNRLDLYPADPAQRFLGTNTTLSVMGQETGHQWLAFLQFEDAGVCSDLLLGRDLAHWSFFKDSDASNMEGNDWRDNGDGTFTTVDATARFSVLDQYAMGLRPAAEVPPFFFVANPSVVGCAVSTPAAGERSCAPRIGVTVAGGRRTVTAADIVACEGERWPPTGYSMVNPTTTWRQAFVLLVPPGTNPSPADLTKIETIRAAWVPYFNAATGGRGTVDTALVPGGEPTPRAPPPPEPIRITSPASGSVFPLGATVTFTWTSIVGAAAYLFEFSGTNLRFTNPNDTRPDGVNGLGGGGGFMVAGTSTTVTPDRPPGTYEVRVLALGATGTPIGTFSDAVSVFWGVAPPSPPDMRPVITAPASGSRLRRDGVTPEAFLWTPLAGVFVYGF